MDAVIVDNGRGVLIFDSCEAKYLRRAFDKIVDGTEFDDLGERDAMNAAMLFFTEMARRAERS